MLEERLFFSGINTDDEDRKLEPGDYRWALNIDIASSDGPYAGAIVNNKGARLVSTQLPPGDNAVIGTKEDLDSNRCYYFLYNSLGNHTIYRYSFDQNLIEIVMQGSVLNFSKDHRVNHANIVDEKLLYWTDNYNPPRKINIEKAIETGKKRKYSIYFGNSFSVGQSYTVNVYDGTGVLVAVSTIIIPPGGVSPSDAYGLSKYFVDNISPGAALVATWKTCGASVEVEFLNVGEYTITTATNTPNQMIAVADNFYPKPYIEAFIDQLKYPFECQPSALYRFDPTRKTNLVSNRIFQFMTRYVYDDYEKSAISPYSVIPTAGGDCGAITAISSLNYIEIDFTESKLNDIHFRSIVRGVELFFREHNTGKIKLITTLQPENIGIGTNKYKFYNDGIYSGVPDAEAAKNFDSVPILNGSQEYVNNRIFDSDILEGYDTTCIDVELNTEYKSAGTFNISGILSIIQPDQGPTGYQGGVINGYRTIPVFSSSNFFGGTGSLFGGLLGSWYSPPYPPYNGSPNYGISSTLADQCKLPLSGFTVYLAGTNYSTVTKQRKITNASTGIQIQQQDIQSGVVNTNTEINFNVVNAISNHSNIYSSSFIQDWTIYGVKPGVYSLRIASHEITAIDSDLDYQRTSTRVLTQTIVGIPGQTGVCQTGTTEAIIEVLPSGTVNIRDPRTYNILRTTTGDCGETFIRDVSTADFLNQGYGIDLYVVDGEGAAAPATASEMLLNQRVTKSTISVYNLLTSTGYNYTITTETDHNGFAHVWSSVFIIGIVGSPIVTIRLTNIVNYQTISSAAGIQVYKNTGAYPATDQANLDAYKYIYFYNDVNFTANGRTKVEGYLRDVNGNVAENVVVASTYHIATQTDAQGFFTFSYYYTSPSGQQSDVVLFSTNGLCTLTASPPFIQYHIDQSQYNNVNHYFVSVPVVAYSYSEINALKRGFDGQFGLVYYDRGNRSSTVNTSEKTNIHILFYTEKDTATGAFYYTQTPQVTWKIKHLPPDWATHYQWVRTKNLQVNSYLQFVGGKTEYVDEPTSTATAVPFAQAKYVRIDLNNIATYRTENANSLLSYTWQVGDRLRFISNYGGNYFTDYFDYEVQAEDSGFIFIQKDDRIGQLQDGLFFELYTPRLGTESKLFYEIGECYEVGELTGIKYHVGPTQDQDPLNPVTTPAVGTFKTGNAWYRGRVIPYTYAAAIRNTLFAIDDESVSDFYASKDDNIGRINIENLDAQQIRREKTVRFSDVYVKESKLNGLSSYSALNYENIQKGEGPVYKLQRAGRVLLAIQRSQVNSLYIEEIVYIDASGNPTLTVSDKVIGTIRPQEKQYGTIHPASVVEYSGVVYWYDATKGAFIRYSNDGLTPIDQYKFISYTRNKTAEVISYPSEKTDVLGGFDPFNNRYIVTFKKNDNLINFVQQTVSFSEARNRWVTEHSYIPESYSIVGMYVVSFKDGNLWVHDDDQQRNNYYGTQYNSVIDAVCNQDSGKVRNFIAISEESNNVWAAPEISIPKNTLYPQGMLSRITKDKFVNKEGVFCAPIQRDINTPNVANPIVNGRAMRGHVLRIKFENDSSDVVILNAINVRYIYSEPSKK